MSFIGLTYIFSTLSQAQGVGLLSLFQMKTLRLGNRESLARFGAADPGPCARSVQTAHLGEAMPDGALKHLLEAAGLSETPRTQGGGGGRPCGTRCTMSSSLDPENSSGCMAVGNSDC